jgi:pyruvate dehydrogenase E1 component alpha subunit
MHLTQADHGMLGSYAIVGAHLPMACGAAWSAKLRRTTQVAVAFFGDGATNIGAFHEALNLAAVWKLPVLFVCENNRYMEYTPIGSVTAVPNPAADRAAANGMPGVLVDGNDVVAVHAAVAEAVERARTGGGPTVLEALTYRHFGHSRTDPATYRPEDEVEEWLARDPLILARRRLLELGAAEADVDAADRRADQLVAAASQAAQAAPAADPDDAFTDVWADGGSTWRT